MPYSVYIVVCSDETYYTGITVDVTRRTREHNESPKGARYTRARRPVKLVYQEELPDKSSALKREYIIKRMSRAQKSALIQTYAIVSHYPI